MKKNFFTLLIFLLAQGLDLTSAPDFTITDIEDNPVCLDSLLAKGPVLVSFWALSCKMCIKAMQVQKKAVSYVQVVYVDLKNPLRA